MGGSDSTEGSGASTFTLAAVAAGRTSCGEFLTGDGSVSDLMSAAVTLTEAVTKLSVKFAVVNPDPDFLPSLFTSSFTSSGGETRSSIPSSRCSDTPPPPLL